MLICAVVRDSLNREGIVCSREPRPTRSWLDAQDDSAEIKALAPDVEWWGMMPFDGGYLLCPGPHLKWLRDATYEDFLLAVDHAGTEGRLQLAQLFPHYLRRAQDTVVAERGSPQ